MTKNILILEDNDTQLLHLKALVNTTAPEIIVHMAHNYSEACMLFSEIREFAFFMLDIDLGDNPDEKDGLDFAKYIRSIPEYEFVPMIYISSISDRLEEAFMTTHCYEFIKKPYNDFSIQRAIEKMLIMPEPAPAILNIKGVNDSQLHIAIKDIIYIESSGHQITIYTADNGYLSRSRSLKHVLSLLPSHFVQCHKSFIINTHMSMEYHAYNNTLSIANVPIEIPVGRKYRALCPF